MFSSLDAGILLWKMVEYEKDDYTIYYSRLFVFIDIFIHSI